MSKISMKMATGVAVIGGIVAGAVSASAALNLPTMSCAYTFNTNMKLNSRGTDVMNLQKVLNMYPQTQVATEGAGSPGMETTKFGPATRAAVNKFQALHLAELGVTAPTGNVFAGTRALLNQVCSNGNTSTNTGNTGNTGTVVSGPVSVMVASSQPANIVVTGQAAANVGNFVFSGNGMVKSVKLMRVGLSDDTTLTNVYLYDGMVRVAGPASVSRDGTVVFSSYNGLFAVAGSKTISVRGDVKSTITGNQSIGFAVASVDTGAGLTALTNVTGPVLTVGSVALATVTVSDPTVLPLGGPFSPNAGSVAQNLWERSLSVSTRDVKLAAATFKMIGSAPYSSLANVNLNVDGVNVAQGTVDSNGYVRFALPASYTLTTGSHTVKVFGDIVSGASRNFYMSLEQLSDVMIEDTQVAGAYVTLSGAGASSNMVGPTFNVQQGNFTITRDSSLSNVTTLVGGATNQTLAKWKFSSYGEDVKVLSVRFTPHITGGTTAAGAVTTLTNVGLFVNGAQVRSNQTATDATPLNYTDLGTNFVVPAGQSVTVELRGDLVSAAGDAYTAATAVSFDVTNTGSSAQGMWSQSLVSTFPTSSGQSFSVGGSNVTFATAAGSASRTVAPNTANVKIGSFSIQTGSAEGVSVTSVNVGFSATSTLVTGNKLANLTVKDGSTVLGNVIGLPTTANNFSVTLNVPQSTTKTIDIYADIQSGASGKEAAPQVTISYSGLSSRQSKVSTLTYGVRTTAGTATIAPAGITFVPGSSPTAQFVLGGTTGLNVATFNVKNSGTTGGAVIKDMVFTVVPNTISSVTVNGKTASVVGTTATVYDVGYTVPSDASGINIPVSVNLVCANQADGCAGSSNSNVTLTLTSITYNDGEIVQGPVTPAVAAVTPTHKLVATRPTITMAGGSSAGLLVGSQQIGTFTISADAAGDIKIEQIPVVTSVNGTITIPGTTVELRDSAGNVLSGAPAMVNVGAQNFVFATPRTITKGTSETYTVYATTGGSTGSAGTSNVTFSLGAKANFLWTDVIGNQTGITGTNLNNFPTSTYTKTN